MQNCLDSVEPTETDLYRSQIQYGLTHTSNHGLYFVVYQIGIFFFGLIHVGKVENGLRDNVPQRTRADLSTDDSTHEPNPATKFTFLRLRSILKQPWKKLKSPTNI